MPPLHFCLRKIGACLPFWKLCPTHFLLEVIIIRPFPWYKEDSCPAFGSLPTKFITDLHNLQYLTVSGIFECCPKLDFPIFPNSWKRWKDEIFKRWPIGSTYKFFQILKEIEIWHDWVLKRNHQMNKKEWTLEVELCCKIITG